MSQPESMDSWNNDMVDAYHNRGKRREVAGQVRPDPSPPSSPPVDDPSSDAHDGVQVVEMVEEDWLLNELEEYGRRGKSRSVDEVTHHEAAATKPTWADAHKRAQDFQQSRKKKTPWTPPLTLFDVPEFSQGAEASASDEVMTREWNGLSQRSRDAVHRRLSLVKDQLAKEEAAKESKLNEFIDIASKGVEMMKYGRFGKPKIKTVTIDPEHGTLSWGEKGSGKVSALVESTSISPGKNTKVWSKVNYKQAHPAVCFSVIFQDRTLDFKLGSEDEMRSWVAGLIEVRNRQLEKRKKAVAETGGAGLVVVKNLVDMRPAIEIYSEDQYFALMQDPGIMVDKYTRYGTVHRRPLKIGAKGGIIDWGTGRVSIMQVTDIWKGKSSKTFSGVKHTKVSPNMCFSIVAAGRTIDMAVSSEQERNLLVKSLFKLRKDMFSTIEGGVVDDRLILISNNVTPNQSFDTFIDKRFTHFQKLTGQPSAGTGKFGDQKDKGKKCTVADYQLENNFLLEEAKNLFSQLADLKKELEIYRAKAAVPSTGGSGSGSDSSPAAGTLRLSGNSQPTLITRRKIRKPQSAE